MDTSYSFTAGAEDLLKRANFPKEAVPAPTDGSGRWDKASLTQFLASQGITVVEQPIEPQVPAAPTSFASPPSPEAQIMGIGDAASAEVVPGGETMDSLFADGAIAPGAMPPPMLAVGDIDTELKDGNINEFAELGPDASPASKPGRAAQPSYDGPTNDDLNKILSDTRAHYGQHPINTVLTFGWNQRAIPVQLMNDGDWVITGSTYDPTTLSKTLTVQKVK